LYQIAYAIQRTESVGWWLGLISHFNDTDDINSGDLKTLTNDYIQDAQQSIIYSQVILEEIGQSSSLLTEAEQMLENAKSDEEEGYYAAALFEALEALSKGNLALELVDTTTNEKILSKLERANESANAGISESRLMGIEPVLAVSYYEYAESLMQSSAQDSLFYFKYSDLITGVLTLTSSCSSDQSSRYVGIPEPHTKSLMSTTIKFSGYLLIFAAFGAIGGLSIGLIIGYLMFKKEKTEAVHQVLPKEIPTTFTEEKYLSTQQESFPDNIYDMYKKDK
jgi:predicted S18 family serine protease